MERVVALVGDLLDSSRLEQGLFALNRQPVDVVDLVRETCAALTTNSVPIRVDGTREDIVLAVDPNRIRQAVVTVTDQGPGIPPEFFPPSIASLVDLAPQGSGSDSTWRAASLPPTAGR